MSRLAGKTALITGGRQGIGRAIVDLFDAQGAQILTCGRGPKPDDLPDHILWQTADVSVREDIEMLKQSVINDLGTLSILVNNAGIQIEKTILETTDDDWDRLIGTNCKGVFLCCRELLPLITKGGAIINIGSISATTADRNLALYNASKAFVQGLTRSIAVDHGPAIRCNAISPGWIMTDMSEAAFALANDPDAAQKEALSRHPVGRFGKPEDIASLALWLASDEAEFATGQCYVLDGGLTAASPLDPGLF